MISINRLRESDLKKMPEIASKLPLKYIPVPKHQHGESDVRKYLMFRNGPDNQHRG
jgi:hypothetical protein